MFSNKLDAFFTKKNLPLSWCNAFLNRVDVIEPPFRGHQFFMAGIKKYLPENFLGKKFGRLIIIKEVSINPRMVEAQCECGVVKQYVLKSIMRGLTKSCGCLQIESRPLHTKTHGLSKHRLYGIYYKMIDRCYKPQCEAYHNYGGRGIKICQEWLDDFMVFYNWAINNGHKDGLEIDRIDNNGNYEPNNCRWTTELVGARNRRTNLPITFRGETKIAVEWAEQYGMSQKLFHGRRKRGWSIERALTTPKSTDYKFKRKLVT